MSELNGSQRRRRETNFSLKFDSSAVDRAFVKQHRSRSRRKSKSQRLTHTICTEPPKTPTKLSRIKIFGLLSAFVSVLSLYISIQQRASVSPQAPLDKENVFPKFTVVNTGNIPLESVTTECIVNGPGFRNIRIRNVKLRPEAGPMAFEKIPSGTSVSTSCGIRGMHFAEGTQLQIHNTYRMPYLKCHGQCKNPHSAS